MKPWPEKYIGIPFLSKGRSRTGIDCWGLVQLVFRDYHNIVLPSYDHIESTDGRSARAAMEAAANSSDWVSIPVGQQTDFDVVRMRSHYNSLGVWKAATAHVGLVFRKKFVVHVEEGINVVCLPFSHPEVCDRLISFHRYRSLA